jgi:recombination protein RecR
MMDKLPTMAHLLKQLQQLPYVASRHIYRVAHYFLEMEEARLQQFCTSLLEAKKSLIKCSTCCAWKEARGSCLFCGDSQREQQIICVVETWYDLWAIERTAGYRGVYHILGGAICPLEGIGPEELTIDLLVKRASSGHDEVILALNQTPEGEATAAFIGRKLEKLPVKVTCLARGVPIGSTLETLDRLTLHKALSERKLY